MFWEFERHDRWSNFVLTVDHEDFGVEWIWYMEQSVTAVTAIRCSRIVVCGVRTEQVLTSSPWDIGRCAAPAVAGAYQVNIQHSIFIAHINSQVSVVLRALRLSLSKTSFNLFYRNGKTVKQQARAVVIVFTLNTVSMSALYSVLGIWCGRLSWS